MRMPNRIKLVRACCALSITALAACSTMGSLLGVGGMNASQQAANVTSSIRSDADIMGVLHQSNLGEINAGNVAQTRAGDQQVRDFAAMMVRDHSMLDQRGSTMAQQWGIVPTMPSNQLPDIQRAEMDALNAAGTGSSFDRAYMASQVLDHQRTLEIVDAAIRTAQRAELRAMLQNDVRPPVASHLQMAQTIQSRVGTP